MDNIVFLIEIDVPTVTNDAFGYGTPLTANTNGPERIYGTKKIQLTNSMGSDNLDGYFKCVSDVNISYPKLKEFSGVAGRASATITMVDFKGDPDLESPYVQANPNVVENGTYFGKLNVRHILNEKTITIKEFNVTTNQELRVFTMQVVDFNTSSNGKWTISAKDSLNKLSKDSAIYPPPFSSKVLNTPGETGVVINVEGSVSDWAGDYALQVGNELMYIKTLTQVSNTVDIEVESRTEFKVPTSTGFREYRKQIENITSNSVATRVVAFSNKKVSYIMNDIMSSYEINVDPTFTTEIDSWDSNATYTCVFVGEESADDVLNSICEMFLINIYSDPLDGNLVKANSAASWKKSTKTLTEGVEITYNKGSVSIKNELRFSRVYTQYNQFDPFVDNSYLNTETRINTEYEGDQYYGSVKTRRMAQTQVLGGEPSDIEKAKINTVRFLNRFVLKPKVYDVEIRWIDAQTINVGDVLTIVKKEIQRVDGSVSDQERVQVLHMRVKKGGVNTMTCITYEPYEGSTDNHIVINKDKDINLYVEAGAPPSELQETKYTFILKPNGEASYGDRILVGSMNSGASIDSGSGWNDAVRLNIICQDKVTITALGGDGGYAGKGEDATNTTVATKGGDGGIVATCNSRVTMWFYISGLQTVQGVQYDCDGFIWAPGGGGAGGRSTTAYSPTQQSTNISQGGSGGGGLGYPAGRSGPGASQPIITASKTGTGVSGTPGQGEDVNVGVDGANGGDFGATGSDTPTGVPTQPFIEGGTSGKACVHNRGFIGVNINPPYLNRIRGGSGDSFYNPLNPPPILS